MKTTVSVFAAFFFISVLSVSCQGDPGDFNTTFSEIEKWMNTMTCIQPCIMVE